MIKTVSKLGNSQGILFDSALLQLARLKVGDKVSITVHEGGAIVLTPVHPSIDSKAAALSARRLIKKNSAVFRRLA